MLLLLTTYPNDSRKMKKFILGILKQNLAKCISRLNYMKSYYIWENELKQENEIQLLIKLPEENKEKIEKFINKTHPYDCPELVYIKPDQVWDLYLKWINE